MTNEDSFFNEMIENLQQGKGSTDEYVNDEAIIRPLQPRGRRRSSKITKTIKKDPERRRKAENNHDPNRKRRQFKENVSYT